MNKVYGKQTLRIDVVGDNNEIFFGANSRIVGALAIGTPDCPCNNCKIIIGENSKSSGPVYIKILESGTVLEIGKDCLFAEGLNIWASDTHSILDENGNVCNIGKYVKIGNHVWTGLGVFILKNTVIADNSIIGMKSVVRGKFEEVGSVIMGNPAKFIKTVCNWDERRPNFFIENGMVHENN